MKKNLKMELLNSEVEQQVQGGASGFAANALTSASAIVKKCLSYEISGCSSCFNIDKEGGCGRTSYNYRNCWDFEVRDCNGKVDVKPIKSASVLTYNW